jgi:hypothetical protein
LKRLLAVLLALLVPALALAEGMPDELAAARGLGLVSDAMNAEGNASWYDLYDLLDNAIRIKTGRQDMSWASVKAFSLSDSEVSRADAVRVLYLGALSMGYHAAALAGASLADMANAPLSLPGYQNARYEDIAPAGERKQVAGMYDFGLAADAARTGDLITFCIRQEDLISHRKVMELSDAGFRPLEPLTRREAILAVYRLFNSFTEPVAFSPDTGDPGD